jgi:hypothetical protein
VVGLNRKQNGGGKIISQLEFFYFICFCGCIYVCIFAILGFEPQDFALARQVLYHLAPQIVIVRRISFLWLFCVCICVHNICVCIHCIDHYWVKVKKKFIVMLTFGYLHFLLFYQENFVYYDYGRKCLKSVRIYTYVIFSKSVRIYTYVIFLLAITVKSL